MECTTVVPVTGKTKEYCRAQHETKIQAAFAHKQGLSQNVQRVRGEMLVHVSTPRNQLTRSYLLLLQNLVKSSKFVFRLFQPRNLEDIEY